MQPPLNRVYLVRHGEHRGNLTHEFCCRQHDYPLTSRGRLQAEQTAAYFQRLGLDAIYSSPLRRAVETAQALAAPLHLPVTVLEEFRELNVGDLDGQPGTAAQWALHNEILAAWYAGEVTRAFPGGEDYTAFLARLRQGLQRALAGRAGQRIAVVGHGSLFTVPLRDVCRNVDVAALRRGANHNGSITEVLLMPDVALGTGELVAWAAHAHLSGEAALLAPGSP